MSPAGRIAILGPTTLLGQELREILGRRKDLRGRIVLLAASEEEVGAVTETGGAAALVSPAEPAALEEVDLVFSCGPVAHDLEVLRERPEGATAILLSPDATAEDGVPVVAGVNPEAARRGEVIVSPHPAAIALAHLLAAVAALGPESAAATTVQPVSMLGSRGLDDLMDQTRDLLTMSGDRRESVFDRQLAFNLYPAPEGSATLAALVRRATGLDLPLAVHSLHGAVFHGLSVSLFVRFGGDPGEGAVRKALAERRHLRLSDADALPGDVPGPVEAAAEDDLLVGAVRADPAHPGGYWVWTVMDNLTRGGATNAVEIADAACKVFTQ